MCVEMGIENWVIFDMTYSLFMWRFINSNNVFADKDYKVPLFL